MQCTKSKKKLGVLFNWWKEVGVEEYVKKDHDKSKVMNSKEKTLKKRVYKHA
jgi:hypothetical protein